MTIKLRKSAQVTLDGSGNGSAAIGLGAPYGIVLGFEFKTITGTDTSVTLALADRDGRILYAATSLNPATDDSTTKVTEQVSSTKGISKRLATVAARITDDAGAAGTAVGRAIGGVLARGPVTATITTGTSTEVVQVNLIVDV